MSAHLDPASDSDSDSSDDDDTALAQFQIPVPLQAPPLHLPPMAIGAAGVAAAASSQQAVARGSDTTQWADSLRLHESTVWDLLLLESDGSGTGGDPAATPGGNGNGPGGNGNGNGGGANQQQLDPAARAARWDAVRVRLGTHPEDAAVDLYRLYPLHRALMNSAPPPIVRALVKAYPDAVRTENYNNDFPLHIACINEHPPEVIKLLLEMHPDALHHKADGSLPLHWCAEWWRNSVENFELVREQGKRHGVGAYCKMEAELGGLLVEDKDGNTSLNHICDDAEEERTWTPSQWEWICGLLRKAGREALGVESKTSSSDSDSDAGVAATAAAGRATTTEDAGNEDDVPLLHAALQLSCSEKFIRLLLELYPRLVYRRDCLGRVPLGVAASNPKISGAIIDLLLRHEREGAGAAEVEQVEDARRGECSSAIVPIIGVGAPTSIMASTADRSGFLPLHHAALSGRRFDDGIKVILKAAPQALHTRDRTWRLYPFKLAALYNAEKHIEGYRGFIEEDKAKARKAVARRLHYESGDDYGGLLTDAEGDNEHDDEPCLGSAERRMRDEADLAAFDAVFGLLRADPSLIRSVVVRWSSGQKRRRSRMMDEG